MTGAYKWDSEYLCKVEQVEKDAPNMETYVMQVREFDDGQQAETRNPTHLM